MDSTKSLQKVKEIQDICRAHFLYKPFFELPNLSQFIGQYIEVRIEADYLTNENPAIVQRQLWGNDFYTSSSDVVCILIHTGAYQIGFQRPECEAVSVYFKVAKNRANYNNVFKNGIKSRKITANQYEGHSIRFEMVLERDQFDRNSSELVNLQDVAFSMPSKPREIRRKQRVAKKAIRSFKTPYGISVEKYRQMAKGNPERESEFLFCFNLSGQPVQRYILGEFGDKLHPNEDKKYRVADHLKTHVCFLETLNTRYMLQRNEDSSFSFLKVKDPMDKGAEYLEENPVPLKPEDLDMDGSIVNFRWPEIKWGISKVQIKDTLIPEIQSYLWYRKKQ